jgi:hypothetical protein
MKLFTDQRALLEKKFTRWIDQTVGSFEPCFCKLAKLGATIVISTTYN